MVEIRLTNTLTRSKEPFKPLDPKNVRMYVCGPTVYDRAHLGNARPVVVFDVLFRLLRHVYGEDHVTYVRNVTDVDDKINARAAETGRPIRDITDETIRWFHEDMDALGALRPTREPRATEWIGAMIAMIEKLLARGHAYVAEGHVLFRVRSYAEYGALSGRSLDDMIAGARVEVAPFKEDPLDFVLWKPSGEGTPGWPSPWGRGRPGWHIECSAMARELLGPSFDIHGGGLDLQFPHHENEIAQSVCAHPGEGFARVWMHNEMLLVDGKKMSKSLGNFFTVRDLLVEGEPGAVIRFVLLGTHYSKTLDWTDQRLVEAAIKLRTWTMGIRSHVSLEEVTSEKVSNGVIAALSNDLDTHGALKHIDDQLKAPGDEFRKWLQVAHDLAFLGLLEPQLVANTAFWVDWETELSVDVQGRIADLLAQRAAAKKLKDFATADRLRDVLIGAGLILMDGKEPSWKLGPRFDASKLECAG